MRDIFGPILRDDKDVVLAIPPCARAALWDSEHWLHRDDHPWRQDGVNVFAQLQPCFAAVVIRQQTKRVAITERPILQQPTLFEEAIEFGADRLTTLAGLDQALAKFVCSDVGLPYP